ncbi:MAG: hypothetical protein MJ016_07985 [Victivallaceae bacterium]|nr:hypothetical protein [Victivallaceae bacterium]
MAHPWLGKLLALQQSDLRSHICRKKLDSLPGDLKNLLGRRDALLKEVDDASSAVKKIELEIKNGESAVKKLEEDNRKLQQQSAMVKKNAEYQAMLSTIEENKNKTGAIEEKILLLFDDLEAARKNLADVKRQNGAALKLVKEEFDDVVAFGNTLKKEIGELAAARPEKIRGIAPDILRRYGILIQRADAGAPVAPVENGICGRCHMRMTPQTLNLLHKGEVAECDNCQGMIYDPERAEI